MIQKIKLPSTKAPNNGVLNNLEISAYYKNNPMFKGIYHIANFPYLADSEGFYILNMDKPGNAGTHWVVFFQRKHIRRSNDGFEGDLFYYDSYGSPISATVIQYAKHNRLKVHKNNEDHQALGSSLCGFYSMFVADMLAIGIPWISIIGTHPNSSKRIFTRDPSRHNVQILRHWFLR